MKYTDQEKKRLQDNLRLIRNAGGWTAEELGDMIGVTKQTISNLENGKTTITTTQYIALRAVLEYELSEKKDDKLFVMAMNICFGDNKLTEEQTQNVRAYVNGAKKSGMKNEVIIEGVAALAGIAVAALAVPISEIIVDWISDLISSK